MDDYLYDQPWGNFIIDVALAYPIDEEASGYTSSYQSMSI